MRSVGHIIKSFTMRRRQSGLTLFELVITTTLIAILAAVAAPSFQGLIQDQQRESVGLELYHAMMLARTEGIKRGRNVVMCPSEDGVHCVAAVAGSTARWHRGWIMYVDALPNEERDPANPAETLLRRGNIMPETLTLTSGNRRWLRFQPQGTAGGSTATLTLCDARGAAHARAIIVNNAGRPYWSERTSDGEALECA